MSRNVFGRVYEPGKPLSISIPAPSARIDYISFQRRFFESGNCKRVAVTSPSVGKILEHFRIYGTAIPFYSHGDSQPSV